MSCRREIPSCWLRVGAMLCVHSTSLLMEIDSDRLAKQNRHVVLKILRVVRLTASLIARGRRHPDNYSREYSPDSHISLYRVSLILR